ncbi:hypothetical protein PIB30_054428 [Stylosanthes scabra]|uniref:Fe2OG dioxygenase domain-containing protein n=1 Tax=Stylosanthes scabra TaxID=79078 RepID=A0ABU6ZHI8_9FABA|nr:hypothetical protein [Stylosanthes scabra]
MSMVMATPSDLHEFVMIQGNGVKGLYEMGLKTLQKQFIQPLEEKMSLENNEVVSQESIPIIDMSNSNNNCEVEDAICDAAEKWGFFQVINHGVPIQVLESVKDATHRFFELPAEEKVKYTKENSPSKKVRYGSSFRPDAEKALEWKDYLSLFYVNEDEAQATWPYACRDEALEYMKKTEALAKRLLNALKKRLNVNEMDEATEALFMGSRRINLNYYPICPNPNLTVGVGSHSDVSTFTILLQDKTGGLYVRPEDRHGWIHVSPIHGALVINIGDALQIMSNGRYKSIEHQVTTNGSKNRISVPIFVNPRPSDVIGPLPQILASGEKPKYKNVLYSDYVKHFYWKPHDGKLTLQYAKIN